MGRFLTGEWYLFAIFKKNIKFELRLSPSKYLREFGKEIRYSILPFNFLFQFSII